MILAFPKLKPDKQNELIDKDISLVGSASEEVQLSLLENYNKYFLYASEEARKKCEGYTTHLERLSQFAYERPFAELDAGDRNFIKDVVDRIHKNYQERSKQITIERKTSSKLSEDSQKETVINNTLRALYSYLATDDKEQAKKTFKELCQFCCERRFYLGGDKYSVHTNSAQWLIQRISADDDIGKELRELLGIETKNPHIISSLIKNIVTTAQLNSSCSSYKERYNHEVQRSKIHEEKPMPIHQEHDFIALRA